MCVLPNYDAAKVVADPARIPGGMGQGTILVDSEENKKERAKRLLTFMAHQEVTRRNPITPIKIIKKVVR